jgi:hypothetical protein
MLNAILRGRGRRSWRPAAVSSVRRPSRWGDGNGIAATQEKHKAPDFLQGLWIRTTASLQSPSPLPAAPLGTVLQAPEGERMNYRPIRRWNQAENRSKPCNTAVRIAAKSSGQTTCEAYILFPVVGCLPTHTRSKRPNATVTTMSHLAQCRFPRRETGSEESRNSWCHFSIGIGSVVEMGTTATNCWRALDRTTTGRFLTISGGRKPVLKSQIKTWPGFGWNLMGCMIERIYPTSHGAAMTGAKQKNGYRFVRLVASCTQEDIFLPCRAFITVGVTTGLALTANGRETLPYPQPAIPGLTLIAEKGVLILARGFFLATLAGFSQHPYHGAIPMSRPWKERTATYIVRVGEGFKPTSVSQWPEMFTEGRLHVRNLSLTDARATVRAYNKAAMERRAANVPGWDRLWMIAGCCVRAKGRDWDRHAVERPDDCEKQPRGYTSKEIERLLAACHKFYSTKNSVLNKPNDWLRGFVAISLSTGLHPSELLKINGGGLSSPDAHDWQSLCTTFRQTMCKAFRVLVSEAEIDQDGRKGGDRNRLAMLNVKTSEVDKAIERWRQAKHKAEVYSIHLSDQQAALLTTLDEQKRRLAAKVAEITLALEEAAKDAANYRGKPEPNGGVA